MKPQGLYDKSFWTPFEWLELTLISIAFIGKESVLLLNSTQPKTTFDV